MALRLDDLDHRLGAEEDIERITVGGIIWALARSKAEVEALKAEVSELGRRVAALAASLAEHREHA